MNEALEEWSQAIQQALIEENSTLHALHAIFGVLSTPVASEDGCEDFRNEGIVKKTLDTLELIVNSLSPDQFFDLRRFIRRGILSGDPHTRRAACLAALSASTQDYEITSVYWKSFLPIVLKGMGDRSSIVQNAAFFAFLRFGNLILQEDRLEYDARVVEVLLFCLGNLRETWARQNGSMRISPYLPDFFDLVGQFCGQYLKNSDNPLFVKLLDCLLQIFDSRYPACVRSLALIALKRVVEETAVAPYIEHFIKSFHKTVEGDLGKVALPLQIAIIEVLRKSCQRYGGNCFRSMATDIFSLVSATIDEVDTRDGMRSICYVLGYLHDCLECRSDVETMLEYLVTTNLGILREVDVLEKAENTTVDVAVAVADSSQSDSDDDYNRPRYFSERKERACIMLQSLVECARLISFRPYFDDCFDELLDTTYHRNARIRGAALETLSSICVSVHHRNPNRSRNFLRSIITVVPRCVCAITKETNGDVIYSALYALWNILKVGFNLSRHVTTLRLVVDAITAILSSKTCYQRKGNPVEGIEDRISNEKNLKFCLFKFCFDFISYEATYDDDMSSAMFAEIFGLLFPLMLSKACICSGAKRKIVIVSLGDSMKPLAEHGALYVKQLLPVLLEHSWSQNNQIREKSLIALVKYLCYGKEALCPYYAEILKVFEMIVEHETESQNFESICIAIAVMLCTDATVVPLERVLPILIRLLSEKLESCLPVYQDVIHCLIQLYEMGHPLLKDYIPLIIEVAYRAGASGLMFGQTETKDDVAKLIGYIKQDFSDLHEKTVQRIRDSDWIQGELNL